MSAGCARTREVAAELALGIAEGQHRAEAFEHLSTCAACRAEIEQLTATADDLVLVAPSLEPPVGFETTVLAHLEPQPSATVEGDRRPARQRQRRRLVAAAVAAAVLVAVFALGVGLGRQEDGTTDPDVAAPLVTGALTAPDGARVGEVRARSGEQSQIDVTFADPAAIPPGTYVVECIYANGRGYEAGTVTIGGADPPTSWSTTVGHRIDGLRQVRLVGADGAPTIDATLAPS